MIYLLFLAAKWAWPEYLHRPCPNFLLNPEPQIKYNWPMGGGAYPTYREEIEQDQRYFLKKYGKPIFRISVLIDEIVENEPQALPFIACEICKVLDAAIEKSTGQTPDF